LETSLGKTYFSRQFLTINSAIFVWNEPTNKWVEARYVNLGLMMGRRRDATKDAKCTVEAQAPSQVHGGQLGNISRELKRSCPPRLWAQAKKRFVYYNMTTLSKYPNIPWYIPEWLGGYGLPRDDVSEGNVSDEDRYAATIIKMKMLSHKEFRPVLPKDMDEWILHQKVEKQLKEEYKGILPVFFDVGHLPSGEAVILEEEYSKAYKALVCDTVQRLQLKDLSKKLKGDSVHRALQHNSNVWGRAFSLAKKFIESGVSLDMMTDEDMCYENKDIVYPVVIRSHAEMVAQVLPGRAYVEHKPKKILYR
jgi:hypothetical protein